MKVRLRVVQGRDAPRDMTVDADDLAGASAQAVAMGYTVLAAHANGGLRLGIGRATGGRFDDAVFIEQLRDLLSAGLSVMEALQALRSGPASTVIAPLERQLREGQTLSAALGTVSQFDPLLLALVRSAEHTSDLPSSLTQYLEHRRRVAEVRHRVTSALIYPTLLLAAGASVLLFLLFYVMPRFARVFEDMSAQLPWSARAMVWWSQLLHGHTGWLLALAVALVFAAAAAWRSEAVRAAAFAVLLRRPGLEKYVTAYYLARWYRATGMLARGGIPLPQALALTAPLLPPGLRARGAQVEAAVKRGLAPSQAHVQAGMATPVAEQLMRAGERTGDFGDVLLRIAQYHEAETARFLERTMRAVEPMVMAAVGIGVGVVVVLMYMPIFELASAIQ